MVALSICLFLDIVSDILSFDSKTDGVILALKGAFLLLFVVSILFEVLMLGKIQRHPLMNVAKSTMTEPDKPSVITENASVVPGRPSSASDEVLP